MGTVVTLWFVDIPTPLDALTPEPAYHRGFGRKFLALYNPRLPITPIGDFPLNRSAAAGRDEFYIGGFAGLSVVQTEVETLAKVSEISEHLRTSIEAADVYAHAIDMSNGFAGYAHWHNGQLKRAMSALPERTLEDEGLPLPIEGDFWAGRRGSATDTDDPAYRAETMNIVGLSAVRLPFVPSKLADAAVEYWLGFDPQGESPDIPVSAFAVDGRKASTDTVASTAGGASGTADTGAVAGASAAASTSVSAESESGFAFDDYEDEYSDSTGATESVTNTLAIAGRSAKKVGKTAGGWAVKAGKSVWAAVQRRNRS